MFALLKGEGVSRGKGHIPVKIQLRRFDMTDVSRLCRDKNMSQKGMRKVVVDVLTDGLSIGAAFFIVEKHHYPIKKGVIIEIDENGGIDYFGRNLKRFCKGVEWKKWKPEIVDYLLDSYISGILDSEAAL